MHFSVELRNGTRAAAPHTNAIGTIIRLHTILHLDFISVIGHSKATAKPTDETWSTAAVVEG